VISRLVVRTAQFDENGARSSSPAPRARCTQPPSSRLAWRASARRIAPSSPAGGRRGHQRPGQPHQLRNRADRSRPAPYRKRSRLNASARRLTTSTLARPERIATCSRTGTSCRWTRSAVKPPPGLENLASGMPGKPAPLPDTRDAVRRAQETSHRYCRTLTCDLDAFSRLAIKFIIARPSSSQPVPVSCPAVRPSAGCPSVRRRSILPDIAETTRCTGKPRSVAAIGEQSEIFAALTQQKVPGELDSKFLTSSGNALGAGASVLTGKSTCARSSTQRVPS